MMNFSTNFPPNILATKLVPDLIILNLQILTFIAPEKMLRNLLSLILLYWTLDMKNRCIL